MSKVVIKAENISKHYRLGTVGSGTFKEDMKTWWRQKPNRDSQIAYKETNGKNIWALKDINFEINRGEVVGFVGKNGSGKSTLLKIISRVCLPTTGSIKGRGRIASLLEVGTGFHNELTGRENVYLNGQILGMKKREIDAKFDEIAAFSGVEQFLDTPVKRYSSGMYVRLAFAVAANLDPEILIVDEVLAVGDSEFQRKCLAKMKEVSQQEGKTVLFVSHNLQSLNTLCNKAFYLLNGRIVDSGKPDSVIAHYLTRENIQYLKHQYHNPQSAPGNELIRIKKAEIIPENYDLTNTIDTATSLRICFEFWYNAYERANLVTGIRVFTFSGECVFDVYSRPAHYRDGLIAAECIIPENFLNAGAYYLSIIFLRNGRETLYHFETCLSLIIEEHAKNNRNSPETIGFVKPDFPVTLQQHLIINDIL